MPKRVQNVRHATSAADLYTGLEGQLTADITKGEWRYHNGTTPGGIPHARADLDNVAVASGGNDGKMSAAQAANLVQVISDLDALEALVDALDADDIAFDDAGLLVTASDVQTALAAYDAIIVTDQAALASHEADVANPHAVTTTQIDALNLNNNLSDINDPDAGVTNLGIDPAADAAWTAGTSTTKQTTTPAKIRKSVQSFLNWPAAVQITYYGSGTPAGTLPCDGAAVSRTTYSDLFAALGTAFGAGDGSTTFNVPDEKGRASIGTGTGSGLTARARGDEGGEEEHTLTEAELPSISGTVDFRGLSNTGNSIMFSSSGALSTGGGGGGQGGIADQGAVIGGDRLTIGFGSDNAHNNMQPFLASPKFITTGGV